MVIFIYQVASTINYYNRVQGDRRCVTHLSGVAALSDESRYLWQQQCSNQSRHLGEDQTLLGCWLVAAIQCNLYNII